MEQYIKDILFKTRVKSKATLSIKDLVIFDKETIEKLNTLKIEILTSRLTKLENLVIKPLIKEDSYQLYKKLIELLNYDFDKNDDKNLLILELLTNYIILCIKNNTFDIEKLVWSEILQDKYYGHGNKIKIITEIIKKRKKIGIEFFNKSHKFVHKWSDTRTIFEFEVLFVKFADVITIDNIPDNIDSKMCKYIKENYTLNYMGEKDKFSLFADLVITDYKYDSNGDKHYIITDNNNLQTVVKLLINCKSLMMINKYLKEKPDFKTIFSSGLGDENQISSGSGDEEQIDSSPDPDEIKNNLKKEEFKRLLRLRLKQEADTNMRGLITLRKILESKTSKKDIIDTKTNVNTYLKKLNSVINSRSISKS